MRTGVNMSTLFPKNANIIKNYGGEEGFNFNSYHHRQVIKARKDKGLPTVDYNQRFTDYKLVGKRIMDISTNIPYNVVSARKTWYLGWYVTILCIQDNGSSVNLPCDYPLDEVNHATFEMGKQIEEFNRDFIVIGKSKLKVRV